MTHTNPAHPTEQLAASWDWAASGSTVITRSVIVAGLVLRIEAAGAGMFDLLWPALSHHPRADDQGPADLVVRLWDLESTGAPRPELPAGLVDREEGELRPIAFEHDVRVRFDPASQTLTGWDRAQGVAWWCASSSSDVTWWDQAAPFRCILGWWLETTERQMIHSAAIGDDAGAVMLAGPSGSGKSTTALACQRAGLGYLGDDYCALSHDGSLRVHSVYGTAKLLPHDPDLQGRFADHLIRPRRPLDEKAVVLVSDLAHPHITESAPVRAVLAVRIGSEATSRIVPASRASVLAALAPSSILQLPGTGGATFAGLAELVRSVPVAILELGRDRDEIVDLVGALSRGAVLA